jgi:ubiquinone/menaquinone biosynthesis C-methylase UbiE
MIFIESDFSFDLFFKYIKKNYSILDYGCGTGIWAYKKKFHKLNTKFYLYDKNKLVLKIIKNKYRINKNFKVVNNLKEINTLKNKIDVLFLNSTVQYINKLNLEKLLINLTKLLKKNYLIIISDIPKFNRFVEFFLILFFYPRRLFRTIIIIINFNNYIKKNKFYFNNLDINFLKKNFDFKKVENFNKFKFRYSLILKKKS